MQFEDLINFAVLALVIGISTSTLIKDCRKLRDAEPLAAKAVRIRGLRQGSAGAS